MTPAARTSAAIDLLTEVERTARPVDVASKGFFRRRRYAGSGDRRFVIGLVYDSFRQRGQALHEIREIGLDADPRRLILMALKGVADDPSAFFDGSQYGPACLSDTELSLFGSETDDEVGAIWPLWMQAAVEQRFGDAATDEMLALNGRAATVLRVNSLVTTRDAVITKLAKRGMSVSETEISPLGISLGTNSRPRDLGPRHLGSHDKVELGVAGYEIQDEGSQIAAILVGAKPGAQVVDYCAGGGGKTLALAATMENKGQIYAFDTNQSRLDEVAARVKLAKVRNVQTRLLADGSHRPAEELEGLADRVLVDAPCTGSGTWRRHPEGKWLIKPEDPGRAADRQKDILARASTLVAPGGRMIYVTCSIFPEENEDVVSDFLSSHDEFALRAVRPLWQEALGSDMPENLISGPAGKGIFLSPLRTGTDAFYIAIMERNKK